MRAGVIDHISLCLPPPHVCSSLYPICASRYPPSALSVPLYPICVSAPCVSLYPICICVACISPSLHTLCTSLNLICPSTLFAQRAFLSLYPSTAFPTGVSVCLFLSLKPLIIQL